MGQREKPQEILHTGRRPRYNALWHLQPLGVLNNVDQAPVSKAWQEVSEHFQNNHNAERVRVVVIDTLPALSHPCLQGQIDLELGRDFSRYPVVASLTDASVSQAAAGAHGTAVAGLIAARSVADLRLYQPPCVSAAQPDKEDHEEVGTKLVDLPYCGINPYALLVPIAVSAAPDPAMLAAALDYVQDMKPAAEVIVIADSWDARALVWGEAADRDDYADGNDYKSWMEVQAKLLRLSRSCFVFCAAGNLPINELVFPAALSRKKQGPWAVGACNVNGNDLSYSPPAQKAKDGGARMITTLSSDHPRLDREVQKLDPYGITDAELDLKEDFFNLSFSPADIVTTDVPGPAGYNPSSYDHVPTPDGQHMEIASLFCRFSGTSASTAIAAGLVSLALALDKAGASKTIGQVAPKEEGGLFTLEAAQNLVAAKKAKATS